MPDLEIDVNDLLAKQRGRIGDLMQANDVQSLQIERLTQLLAQRDAQITELTPKVESNGKVKA